MKKIILLIALISTLGFNTKASHNLGGEITYEWLSGSTYNVKLLLYTDCMGVGAPISPNLNYSSTSCGINQFISLSITSTRDISQVCDTNSLSCNGGTLPGITETVYEGVITTMTPCSDWILSYSVCCLNSAIQNITTPSSVNFYVETTLDNTVHLNNKSPYFVDAPRWMIPVNQMSFISAGAYDPDGDSLYFSMVTPLSETSILVALNAGHSATEPFISTPSTSFNNQTGIITTQPTTFGISYISVKVEEFRNGQLIGSVIRDFTTNSFNISNVLPTINNSSLNLSLCAPSDTITIDVFSSDATDSVTTKLFRLPPSSNYATLPIAPILDQTTNYLNDTVVLELGFGFVLPNQSYITYINVEDNQCPIKGIQSYAVIVNTSNCDSVWPGDANTDFIADVFDILPIGVFFNTTGSVRPSATTNWTSQFSPNWGINQSAGTDIKHVDCNGDATIDSSDVNTILLNYNLTHVARLGNEANLTGVNDPTLSIEIPIDTVPNSTPISIPITLGTSAIPADSVYGVVMRISYDPTLIDSIAGITVDFSNSWLGTKGVDMITLDTNFYNNGQIDIGLVRNDGQMMSGFGELLTLNLITIDNLSGKGAFFETLTLDFIDTKIIDINEGLKIHNQQLDSVIIKDITTGIENNFEANHLKIAPNPNSGNFRVYISDFDNSTIEIYNTIGQTINFKSTKQNGYFNIDLTGVEKGLYFVRVNNSEKTTIIEKVIVH
jgi:hypothetical protein